MMEQVAGVCFAGEPGTMLHFDIRTQSQWRTTGLFVPSDRQHPAIGIFFAAMNASGGVEVRGGLFSEDSGAFHVDGVDLGPTSRHELSDQILAVLDEWRDEVSSEDGHADDPRPHER